MIFSWSSGGSGWDIRARSPPSVVSQLRFTVQLKQPQNRARGSLPPPRQQRLRLHSECMEVSSVETVTLGDLPAVGMCKEESPLGHTLTTELSVFLEAVISVAWVPVLFHESGMEPSKVVRAETDLAALTEPLTAEIKSKTSTQGLSCISREVSVRLTSDEVEPLVDPTLTAGLAEVVIARKASRLHTNKTVRHGSCGTA